MRKSLPYIIFLTAVFPAFSQIGSVGIGLGFHQATRYEPHITSSYVMGPGDYLILVNDYEAVKVNSIGGGFTCNGNISFIGWLINNAWDDLKRGFYIGDYIGISAGFGPCRQNGGDKSAGVDMQLLASFSLGVQAGYKISSLPDLASIEFRWHYNGTGNSIRTYDIKSMKYNYDDLMTVGLTGRYGSYVAKIDYGYKHLKADIESFNVNSKSFSIGGYWLLDRSKSYSPGSFNSALGVRYEGFYNYFLNNYNKRLNGRNHSINLELIIMKF